MAELTNLSSVQFGRRSPVELPVMASLDLVQLTALMDRTSGRAEISIGLIDGPVDIRHPDLADATINLLSGKLRGKCERSDSAACMHATFVAGILSARRGS